MKRSLVRNSLFLVVVVAQPLAVTGCMESLRIADKQTEAMSKRMKQVEKEAANVSSKRDTEKSSAAE